MVVATDLMSNSTISLSSSPSSYEDAESDNIAIGTRIRCNSDLGTVKYVGELAGYSDSWLGIDWDNPSRGKHNGTVGGVVYFEASHPTSGSFVRPNKVTTGITIDAALRKKYCDVSDERLEKINQQKLQSFSRSIKAPFLEFVGFQILKEKQSDFKKLRVVCLRDLLITDCNNPLVLAELCPNIRELDLSHNLFTQWSSVLAICQPLQYLERLNLSENKMVLPADMSKHSLNSLKHIIIGELNISWNSIVQLSEIWPNIVEIRAPLNNITSLSSNFNLETRLQNITTLFLQYNPIESWDEILHIGVLPSLEKLILTGCRINRIYFDDCKPVEKTKYFKKLKTLSLAENLIDNWESISELNKLENLSELRTQKNPFDQLENSAMCFQLVVGRIEKLMNLNGTELQPDEKRGAEYDYMRKHSNEWLESVKDPKLNEEFIKKHPRFPGFIEKYGSPEEVEKERDRSLKSNLIELEIIDVENEISVIKKLPPNMLVQKLNTLIQRLFKMENSPTLSYVSAKGSSEEREMNNGLKDLGFYSLQKGDKIFAKQS